MSQRSEAVFPATLCETEGPVVEASGLPAFLVRLAPASF